MSIAESGIFTVLFELEAETPDGWKPCMFYSLKIGQRFRIVGPPKAVDGKIYEARSEVIQDEHCTPGIEVRVVS